MLSVIDVCKRPVVVSGGTQPAHRYSLNIGPLEALGKLGHLGTQAESFSDVQCAPVMDHGISRRQPLYGLVAGGATETNPSFFKSGGQRVVRELCSRRHAHQHLQRSAMKHASASIASF